MTKNGAAALGGRPLAVILAQYEEYPDLADASFYDDLVFNYTKKSANGYFIENSHGRFYWQRAGNGTYFFNFPKSQYDGVSSGRIPRVGMALQALSTQLDLAQFDSNGDGVITSVELVVLLIENATGDAAVNRSPSPDCFAPDNSSVQVCLDAVAMVGLHASFSSVCHELSHRLGTIEMYGEGGSENFAHTLMGATIIGYDDPRTFHLDPWHKMMLGWTDPRLYRIDSPGSATIAAAQLVAGSEPVILYSPVLGPTEFFMLEYRSNKLPDGAGYDADVRGSGLVVWHIKTKGNGGPDVNGDVEIIDSFQSAGKKMITAFMNGSPYFSRGTGFPWPPATTIPYSLRFISEVDSGVQLQIGNLQDGGRSLPVSWGPFQVKALPPSRKLLFYNGSTGAVAIGAVGTNASISTLREYGPGSFGAWSTIAGNATELVFYQTSNGALATGEIDASGSFINTRSSAAGVFSAGWTHIVRHNGYLLFYNANTGRGASGQFEGSGFHQYGSFSDFAKGWTHIVSTPNGLFFYNAADGSGAVGDWEYVKSGSGFGQITAVNFTTKWFFSPGSFSTGWTQIANTSNGLLFYAAGSGSIAIADVAPNGNITTRPNSVRTIRQGWTHVVADNDDILFYNSATGDGAIGGILSDDLGEESTDQSNRKYAGSLDMRRNYTGAFSRGWSRITTSVDPIVVR